MFTKTRKLRSLTAMGIAVWMFGGPLLIDTSAQRQRSTTTRSTTTRSTSGTATRSTTTHTTTTSSYHHGGEGYAAVGPRGAVVKGEEGAAAVGRYGNAVVVGEEGYAAKGRYGGVVVGETYEDHDAWRAAAAVTRTAIAIGTMIAAPPTGATTVVVTGTTYWIHANTYYRRVYVSGVVHYQVVARPHY